MKTEAEIDCAFRERAMAELNSRGTSATEFVRLYPKKSKQELAELLGNGVTSRGLTMVLFKEARERDDVCVLAKDLLFRKILDEYPNGWYHDEKIHAVVRLGAWHYDVLEFAPDCEQAATLILRSLATENPPALGWIPEDANDERLTREFESKWRRKGNGVVPR